MASAVRLAECGYRVTLLETRPRLGGRATSHRDPATGQAIDNCQHVLLGCCTNLIDFYQRLGVTDQIEWHERLYFADKQGHRDVLARDALPAPSHLTMALLGMGCLSWQDKRAIARGMWSLMRIGRSGRPNWSDRSFADWLKQTGQTERAIDRFWVPIVVSACNQMPATCSATYAMQVFQDGFLAHRDAYMMGVAKCPLVELYDGVADYLSDRGSEVRLGNSIDRIETEGDRVTGVVAGRDERLTADVYVSALPFERLNTVIDAPARELDDRLAPLDQLTTSPIVGIHLWLDRDVLDRPHLIFVDSPLQWVFKRTGQSDHAGTEGEPVHLHGVVSAADEWLSKSSDGIAAMAMNEMADYLPGVRQAELVRSMVIREKRATFAATPGVDAFRPGPTGKIGNLYLAGDWTATGWPATMEGAVRSGYAAAGAIAGRPMLVDDLRPSWLYGMLGK